MKHAQIVIIGLLLLIATQLGAQDTDRVENSSIPTLEETLAWLKKFDVDYPRPRFHTLTVESLNTLTAMTLGGHTRTGHVHIPPEEFRYLTPLTGLRQANLGEIDGLSDEALVHVGKLTALTHLYLHDGKLTDTGMKHLTNLKGLRFLVLGANREITDAGLAELVKLKELEDLRVSYTKVGDAGMKMLQALPNLKTLWILNTEVTDEGIRHLSQIKTLTTLHVNYKNNDRITEAAVLELQKALPNCKVNETPQLSQERDDVELDGNWFYDDLDAGYAEARRTKKPMLVVFR